ncbi:MAG: TlpA disulfide reductase family protein [Phycisphaerales bacterium]|nr:TlpA disulfide reductase family protein [Phycisphaerales bacterium]
MPVDKEDKSTSNRWAQLGVLLLCGFCSIAAAQPRGIVGQAAPPWHVDSWVQTPPGAAEPEVGRFRGKVIYLYGFQSWCPGCHSKGFPTLQQLIKRFDGEDDVVFVAVQTTFEGYDSNTPAKALEAAKRYDLKIPIGHSGTSGKPSKLMRNYRTGGTPWTIIIDRSGVVRFNDFHVTPDAGYALITRLLAEPQHPSVQTLPTARGGQDVIGETFSKPSFTRWIKPKAEQSSSVETAEKSVIPKLTLYRWWTDGCGYCRDSLPAMDKLRDKYGSDGLRIVGVYHPKPPRPIDDAFIRGAAHSHGFRGEIAVDESWEVLRTAYLNTGQRAATSISILVDEDGIIRFVHPGPVLFPSKDPENAQENQDFAMLDSAIATLLRSGQQSTKE